MSTKGDRILDRSLAAIGGKGLFIKELESALEDGRADLAVHSMKDVPAELPAGMTLAAVLPRADPRDALITRGAPSLADLPRGARLGTSSLRRQAQLLAARPDLRIEPLRGNVETRLKRLDAGELDAIVLACAGLTRLGLESRIGRAARPERFAAGGRPGGHRHRMPRRTIRPPRGGARARGSGGARGHEAERAFARRLGGSCQSPIAAFAELEAGDRLTLEGLVAEPDGSRLQRDCIAGSAAQAAGARRRARRARAGGGRRRAARAPGARLTPQAQVSRATAPRHRRPGHPASASGGAALPAVRGPRGRSQPLSRHRDPAARGSRTWAARLGTLGGLRSHHLRERQRRQVRRRAAREQRDLPLAAIGPATARALNQAGYRVSVQPVGGLRFGKPAAPSEAGIGRGQPDVARQGQRRPRPPGARARAPRRGGVPRRGVSARVRRRPRRRSRALESRFAQREIQVITATSVEIGANLLALATPALRRYFDAAHWLVPSARVAEVLRERGSGAPVVRALGRRSGLGVGRGPLARQRIGRVVEGIEPEPRRVGAARPQIPGAPPRSSPAARSHRPRERASSADLREHCLVHEAAESRPTRRRARRAPARSESRAARRARLLERRVRVQVALGAHAPVQRHLALQAVLVTCRMMLISGANPVPPPTRSIGARRAARAGSR